MEFLFSCTCQKAHSHVGQGAAYLLQGALALSLRLEVAGQLLPALFWGRVIPKTTSVEHDFSREIFLHCRGVAAIFFLEAPASGTGSGPESG